MNAMTKTSPVTNTSAANSTDTTSKADVQEALRNTCMLVTLSMSAWSPVRVDRELSNDVATARDATARAFTVRKDLFPGADASFKTVNLVQASFRRYHYDITLPFGTNSAIIDRGPRLLANANFMKYTETLVGHRKEMNRALDRAVETFAENVDKARLKLGSAFKARDYPDPNDLRRLFSMDADFIPIPDGKAFRGLPPDTQDELGRLTDMKLAKRASEAVDALSTRVVGYVERLLDRLRKLDETIGQEGVRKAGLRESLFKDARDLLDMMTAYAIADTPQLSQARRLLHDVMMHDPAALEHEGSRRSLIEQAQDVYACFDL